MKGITQSASALFLLLGLSVLGIATEKLNNPDTPAQDREELKACIIFLALPCTLQGGLMAWGLYRQSKGGYLLQAQTERDRLQSIFYQVIQDQDGKITVPRLAMEAGLSAKKARQFLDEKAVEFDADFEVSDRGEIFYSFNFG
jgi:hypothetical protein